MKIKRLLTNLVIIAAIIIAACSEDSIDFDGGGLEKASSESGGSGKGGSLARFAIKGNHLYTVDQSTLQVFDISTASDPTFSNQVYVDFGIETIYPYKNNLFLGSQFGMYTYDISSENATDPEFISYFQHIYSCDPVVVDDEYAYVTLSTESWCGRNTNELQIVDISDLENPFLVIKYDMKSPKGLGIDGDTLFVCDEGIKMYDITNVNNIKLKTHFNVTAHDVIPYRGNLLVIGSDGFRQYDYSGDELTLLSSILVDETETEKK